MEELIKLAYIFFVSDLSSTYVASGASNALLNLLSNQKIFNNVSYSRRRPRVCFFEKRVKVSKAYNCEIVFMSDQMFHCKVYL